MNTQPNLDHVIAHVVRAIDTATEREEPFFHLQLAGIFPDDVYALMLAAMPVVDDYRPMSGRTKSTRRADGICTRVKIDLFPEYIRHLPAEKKNVWKLVGRALRSSAVRDAFVRRLGCALERRFGPSCSNIGLYPIPILTRDVPGYSIGIHPDTRWKGITVQLYLPRDNSIKHVGTVFHSRNPDKTYVRASQMSFSPNTGYAFAVDKNTYHSVDTLGPEATSRDSILLTYFVDSTRLQFLRNRAKRLGNFILNETRAAARQ
jgi:hypothetical protein